jgi:hypothetical protein
MLQQTAATIATVAKKCVVGGTAQQQACHLQSGKSHLNDILLRT